MPLEVSRFSFYLVTWHFSDLISMREVMPLTLASPAPGHGSSLSPPVSSCRDGQKRSAAALGASSSNALLCPAKARVRAHTHTHARTHAVSLLCSHGPAWSTVCQPQLVGRSQLGLARSLRHMVSWSGREAATPRYWCMRCRWGNGEVWGVGSRLSCTAQTACETTQASATEIRWTHISHRCHPFPKGTGFQTGVLFC